MVLPFVVVVPLLSIDYNLGQLNPDLELAFALPVVVDIDHVDFSEHVLRVRLLLKGAQQRVL